MLTHTHNTTLGGQGCRFIFARSILLLVVVVESITPPQELVQDDDDDIHKVRSKSTNHPVLLLLLGESIKNACMHAVRQHG